MNILNRFAYKLFGKIAYNNSHRYYDLREQIRKASLPETVDQYVSSTYLYSLTAGILTGIFGLTAGYYIFNRMDVSNLNLANLPELAQDHFAWFMAIMFGLLFMTMAAYMTYFVFMKMPSVKADVRKTEIDQSLAHSVAYLYALSRGGGMNLFEIFKSLGKHAHIYGTAAEEFGNIVRDVEYFGYDILTAMDNAIARSPSENFKEFIQGLVSTFSSGGNSVAYLKSKTDQYHYSATREQKLFLEMLEVLAEAYISVFVVGPLLLMTILFVLGFIGFDSTTFLYLLIYFLIPGATLIYIIFLSMVTSDEEKEPDLYEIEKDLNAFDDVRIETGFNDDEKLIKRIQFYRKLSSIMNSIAHPIRAMQDNPFNAFFASVPLALFYLSYLTYSNLESLRRVSDMHFSVGKINVGIATAVDEHILFMLAIVFIPYIAFYEMKTSRIRQIEDQIPEFLKRLANINEAGILLVDAISMTTRSRIGILHYEVKRMAEDLAWGASMSEALRKFESRIRTNMTSRIITLLIKASESTSDIKSVLIIAANNSELQKQLKKERRAQMTVYVFIIYLSFLVYLFIIYLLTAYFLTAMPNNVGEAIPGMPFRAGFSQAEYTMLFFHTSLIQGFCSGLVAGKMGSGKLKAGLKHSFAMMIISYAVFTLLI